MKKVLGCVVLLLSSFGLAADPNAVIESALPLEGALEAGASLVVSQYLPGYGLQVNTFTFEDGTDAELSRQTVVELVNGLASTIRGLDPDDWVSVGLTRSSFMGDRTLLVVRIKPGQPDTLEVWVNGERQ